MAVKCIEYKDKYKFQLAETYIVQTPIYPPENIFTDFCKLLTDGVFTIYKHYAWDGATCFPDVNSIIRGSLGHDCFYQLFRWGLLDRAIWLEPVNRFLQQNCIEDGMWSAVAWGVYQGVKIGGDPCADPSHKKPILTAPKGCSETNNEMGMI